LEKIRWCEYKSYFSLDILREILRNIIRTTNTRAENYSYLKQERHAYLTKKQNAAVRHELKMAQIQVREAQEESIQLRQSMDINAVHTRQSVQTLELERSRHEQWRNDADKELRLLNEEINVDKNALAHSLHLTTQELQLLQNSHHTTQRELSHAQVELGSLQARVREAERAELAVQLDACTYTTKIDQLTLGEQLLRNEKDELETSEQSARQQVVELENLIADLRSEVETEMEMRYVMESRVREIDEVENRALVRVQELETALAKEEKNRRSMRVRTEEVFVWICF